MLADNPVRAKNIKFQKELYILAGSSCRQLEYFKEKFRKEFARDKTSGVMRFNPYYSEQIADLVQRIEDICECRLVYSGTTMDIFLLLKHYGYTDEGRAVRTKIIP